MRFTILSVVALCCCCVAATGDETVELVRLSESNWDEYAPVGKEVDAIYGDYVLRNDFLCAVVAQPGASRHANMTVRSVGGCLIDLVVREHPSDQLSAFYPGRRSRQFRDVILGDASETDEVPAHAIRCIAGGTATTPEYVVTYSLNPGDRFLTVESVWTNTTSETLPLTLSDDMRADAGREDMLKSSNGVHDLFWVHDVFWQQAWGIRSPGHRIRANSNSRESVLDYVPTDGESRSLKPGETFRLIRHVIPARDLPQLWAIYDEIEGDTALHDVSFLLRDSSGAAVAGARVEVQSASQQRGTTVTDDEGRAAIRLPTGTCHLNVSVAGTAAAPDGSLTIDVHGETDVTIALAELHRGTVEAAITDHTGASIPAKIEFRGRGETPTPRWGPDTAEDLVRNVAYTPNGRMAVPLVAGDYDVIVSHGVEFDAVFTTLTVESGRMTSFPVSLKRSVNTTGWVSADFHSHSSPSGDNTGSQRGRVLNLAAEHIEFAPCTEHNRVSTYDGHIAELGLQSFLSTVSGMELTGQPLPLNHQNVFPMIHTPRTQDGGGPTTDGSPETQIERIALWDDRSEKLIQQNHPDIGWLFYDKNGDKQPDEGFARSFTHMDVIEVHPIDAVLDLQPVEIRNGKPFRNSPFFNWLQLLNQGFRIYGVVNTDAHYNFHGSGGLRNWIQSSTDEPGQIDPDEMRVASEQGRIVMSNGPFLDVQVVSAQNGESVGPGQDLTSASGTVSATMRVECPDWMDVDTVFVLVNGRKRDELTYTRESHADLFNDGPVKFEQTLEISLSEDSHLIFAAGHRTERLGDVLGPDWGSRLPAAVSNPIFVNVDGGEFQPSLDTLGHPLPVKY